MREVFDRELTVTLSMTDASGRISYADAFRLFIDAAAAHAEELGLGLYDMRAKDLFWLAVKTRVHFGERPRIGSRFILRTWPEAADKIRGNRSYQIIADGKPVVWGKTEWAILNTGTNRLVPMRGIYPPSLTFTKESASPEPFSRIDPENAVEYARYTVRSTDIDVGKHMNNVAYVRAVLGSFSSEELEALDPASIEVLYKTSCFEGEELVFSRESSAGGTDIAVTKNGEPAVMMRIKSGNAEAE